MDGWMDRMCIQPKRAKISRGTLYVVRDLIAQLLLKEKKKNYGCSETREEVAKSIKLRSDSLKNNCDFTHAFDLFKFQ